MGTLLLHNFPFTSTQGGQCLCNVLQEQLLTYKPAIYSHIPGAVLAQHNVGGQVVVMPTTGA